MSHDPEYANFIAHVTGKKVDALPCDEETTASKEEIGWWMRYQFARAILHARARQATFVELHLLAKHGKYFPSTPCPYRFDRIAKIKAQKS